MENAQQRIVAVDREIRSGGGADGVREFREGDGRFAYTVRHAAGEEHGEPGLLELGELREQRCGQVLGGGDDQRAEGLAGDFQTAIPDAGPLAEFGGDDVEIHVAVVERAGGLLHEHRLAVGAHPFGLGVVEDGGGGYMASAGKEMRRLVGVAHDGREAVELRVAPVRAEVRGAVRVGVVGREGVRYEVVDAADEQESMASMVAPSPQPKAPKISHGATLHVV